MRRRILCSCFSLFPNSRFRPMARQYKRFRIASSLGTFVEIGSLGTLLYSRNMRSILRQRALRFVFIANVVSMLGSGMNSSAVAWFILKSTHSEIALGTLTILQTIPAMLILPFTGVIIDREDRRRLVMMLDAVRGIIILFVAVLAFRGKAQLWQLYLMN